MQYSVDRYSRLFGYTSTSIWGDYESTLFFPSYLIFLG